MATKRYRIKTITADKTDETNGYIDVETDERLFGVTINRGGVGESSFSINTPNPGNITMSNILDGEIFIITYLF